MSSCLLLMQRSWRLFFTGISSLDGIKSGNFWQYKLVIRIINSTVLNKLQSYGQISALGPEGHCPSHFKRAMCISCRLRVDVHKVGEGWSGSCGQGGRGQKFYFFVDIINGWPLRNSKDVARLWSKILVIVAFRSINWSSRLGEVFSPEASTGQESHSLPKFVYRIQSCAALQGTWMDWYYR